jgi:predicted dehydrogenase
MAFLARLNRRVRLAACCDRTTAGAEAFAARSRIPEAYGDYQAMLAQAPIDAVYLSVPHDLHAGMIRAAIEAGKHVLVEKPVTRTLEEGREIVRLAQDAPVLVGVNYQYRYDSACYALVRASQQGYLGRLYYGRCNLPWHRDEVYFEEGEWRGQMARAGGGTLLTQGSHLLDILLWAMGSPPDKAWGQTAQMRFDHVQVEDLAMGIVELESGAVVQICSSMIAQPEQPTTIELYGERGTAVYGSRPHPRVRFRGVRVRKERPPIWGLHAMQRSLEGFRAWVIQGRPYLTPAAQALPVLAAVEAIYRSARLGRKVSVQGT